jgi:hypothetical protein
LSSASADLKARFAIPALYPSDRPWGGILVIDPNGLRDDHPGPIYFLLDTLHIKPGLTNKSGSFTATINDNKNALRNYDMTLFAPDTPYIRDNDEFWVGVIQGNDGLPNDESGLVSNWTPESGGRAWIIGGFIVNRSYQYDADRRITAKITGTDYMELWRSIPVGSLDMPLQYLMAQGAYSDANFNYAKPTEIYRIFEQALAYVNQQQPQNYRFTPSDDYFPATASNQGAYVVDGVVSQYRRQYSGMPSNLDAFSLMEKLCEAGGLEWQIVPDAENQQWGYASPLASWPPVLSQINVDGTGRSTANGGVFTNEWRFLGKASSRRMLMVYPRTYDGCAGVYDGGGITIDPPTVGKVMPNWMYRGSSTFNYSMQLDYTNIRKILKLIVDDTTQLATHIQIYGDVPTYPANPSVWCDPALWIDADDASWKYTAFSTPLPPNPYLNDDARWVDNTLVWDDQGYLAIVFRKWALSGRSTFMPMLGFHPGLAHQPWALRLLQYRVDAREYRRLKFRFRHPGYDGTGTYRVKIHTDIGSQPYTEWASNYYYYDLTVGAPGPQEVAGAGKDSVQDDGWREVNLLLPEVTEAANSVGFTITGLNGWVAYGTPDVTKLDWVSFEIVCNEAEPGILWEFTPEGTWNFMARLPISNVHAGSPYFTMSRPEKYFLIGEFGGGTVQGVTTFTEPPPVVVLADTNFTKWEVVRISAIDSTNPPTRWKDASSNFNNVLLTQTLKDDGYTYVYMPAGFEICISQLCFTNNDINERELNTLLTSAQKHPRRWRTVKYTDMRYNGEINERIRQEILRSLPLTSAQVRIDGDLRYHIGFQILVDLGAYLPDFEAVNMMIDDIEYVVDQTDFYMDITLGPSDFNRRSYSYDLSQLQGTVVRKLIHDEIGRNKTLGNETRDLP